MFLGTPRVKCLVLYLVPVITLLTILLSILVSPLSFLNYLLIILLNFLISLLNTMRTKRLALSLLIPVTTTMLLRGVVVNLMTGRGTMLAVLGETVIRHPSQHLWDYEAPTESADYCHQHHAPDSKWSNGQNYCRSFSKRGYKN